jgi:hypothetical protein
MILRRKKTTRSHVEDFGPKTFVPALNELQPDRLGTRGFHECVERSVHVSIGHRSAQVRERLGENDLRSARRPMGRGIVQENKVGGIEKQEEISS